MNFRKRLIVVLFQPPVRMEQVEKKDFLVALMGVYLALILHATWLCIFWAENVQPLVFINVFSVLIFAMNILLLLKWGHTRTVMIISALEVMVHQYFAVYYLGWDLGFQYYLLAVVSYIFMSKFRSAVVPALVTLGCLFSFIIIYFGIAQVQNRPIYVFSNTLENFFFISNAFFIFLLIAIFAYVYSSTTREAERLLQLEYRKSNSLLLNILPATIADQLKQGNELIADYHENTSVLFADMVGFTQFSRTLNPRELVSHLNAYFTRFDQLVEKYNVEKIKTIGDAYMVVAGAPEANVDHADALVDLAIEMVEVTKRISNRLKAKVEIRIGINSGPIVAGVIGSKKYIYDIWGDTVNVASRMESHSLPGKIQITCATKELLKKDRRYTLREEVEFKSLGVLQSYFVHPV